jgi:hypothetical protein
MLAAIARQDSNGSFRDYKNDDDRFTTYAGPVKVSAAGRCIDWDGGVTISGVLGLTPPVVNVRRRALEPERAPVTRCAWRGQGETAQFRRCGDCSPTGWANVPALPGQSVNLVQHRMHTCFGL